MKNKLLLASMALLFVTSLDSFSQVNSYFLNNPSWKLNQITNFPENCLRKDIYSYYTNGDSLINSHSYKKIYKQGYYHHTDLWGKYSANCPGSGEYKDVLPSFFMRSSGKKIFVLFNASANEQLLYDFNLQVGDTFPITAVNSATNITVSAIDSIYTPNGFYKRFTLSNTPVEYLLEGIGHSDGLVQPFGPHLGIIDKLECFGLNDVSYFPAVGSPCKLSVGISEYKKEIVPLLFPNPFVDFTTLHFNSLIENAQLNIYNHIGQKLRTLKDVSGESLKIERGSLNSGIYFYEIVEEGGNKTSGKIIIQD